MSTDPLYLLDHSIGLYTRNVPFPPLISNCHCSLIVINSLSLRGPSTDHHTIHLVLVSMDTFYLSTTAFRPTHPHLRMFVRRHSSTGDIRSLRLKHATLSLQSGFWPRHHLHFYQYQTHQHKALRWSDAETFNIYQSIDGKPNYARH